LFRCAAPGSISEIFRSAGLSDVQEVEVHGSLELTSGEEYWSFMTECIAPVVAGLALASDEARSRIHDATLELVEGYASNGAPSLPLHARCISGTK
jgi:hypothetical protein